MINDLLKINVIKYISEKKVDFFSQNDIIIEINYGNYKIKSDIILNNNNPIIDNEYIIKYKKNIPLIINVYDSNNTFGNVILYKKIINNLKKKEFIDDNIKLYYEIIYINDNVFLLNYFNRFYNNILISKIKRLKIILLKELNL
tara:strand:- start:2071 stop:2502 length:432 start_codon:yes stop_codon:yes gene_type:complete